MGPTLPWFPMAMAKKVPAAENQTLRQFGTELARLRSLSETSQRTVAGHTQISPQLVGAIERGERYPSLEFSQKADELLNGGDLLGSLWRKMQNDAYPHFIGELVDVEPLTRMFRVYEPQLVPGLLQTEGFARAALTGGNPRESRHAVERLVTGRIERQRIWDGPAPPHMVAVLDEVVLTRPTGGASVMSAQISRMLTMMEKRLLKVLVVPTERDGHPGLTGPFTLLSLEDGREISYVEEALAGRMVHDREGIRTLSLQFGDLQEVALSPAESQRLMMKLKEGFDGTHLA